MSKAIRLVFIVLFCCAGFQTRIRAQESFQLAAPFLNYPSVFFEKKVRINLDFKQAGTSIHYTTNGQTPGEQDPVYKGPIEIRQHLVTLKARCFGEGFKPSETVEATFYKQGLPIQSISTTLPHERYPGNGPRTLIDGLAGIGPYSGKSWMGFQQDTVRMMLTFAQKIRAKQVLLHVLQNQGAWIFLPEKIEVFGAKKGSNEWILLDTFSVNSGEKTDRNGPESLVFNLKKRFKTDRIILKIFPLSNIPDWHPGKGSPAWFFTDEVKLY